MTTCTRINDDALAQASIQLIGGLSDINIVWVYKYHMSYDFYTSIAPEGNNGCYGGNMYNSYMYVIFNDGVNTQKSYPFEGIVRNRYPNLFTLAVTMTSVSVATGL